MKRIPLYIFGLFISGFIFGQTNPFINSISPIRANVSERLTIVGGGFPLNVTNLKIQIGQATVSNIISNSENIIEVTIPANATEGPVTITNLSTGFITQSSQRFALNFNGGNTSKEKFSDVTDINTGEFFVLNLCDCDLDHDGKTDIVVTSRENPGVGQAKRQVYRNNSTTTSVSLDLALELGEKPSISADCADLDGDGLPELIFTQNNDGDTGAENIEIYKNNSTAGNISFPLTPTLQFALPRNANNDLRAPFRTRSADLDNDGKLDLVVSNEEDNVLQIYLNSSTSAEISFEEPFAINIPDGFLAGFFELGDLNNDNLIDIAVSAFEESPVFIFQNQSNTGLLNFQDPIEIRPGEQTQNRDILIADLNNDGFNDIATTDLKISSSSNSDVEIILNTTSGAGQSISFGEFNTVALFSNAVFGIDAGDVNGDGKVDLAVGILDNNSNTIEILENNTEGDDVSFSTEFLDISENSRFIKVTDLNNDAKPDLIFTSFSLEGRSQPGLLSYLVNGNCVSPDITPASDTYCNGVPFTITATPGVGIEYNWTIIDSGGNPTDINTGANNTLEISTFNEDIQVRVTATNAVSGCQEVSTLASFTLNTGTPSTASIEPTDDFCLGDELILTSSVTADNYFWTGPNGFEQTTTTPSVTVSSSAISENAGTYSLVVENTGGCKSNPASELVTIASPPRPSVRLNGEQNFCENTTTELITNTAAGFDIQWYRDGTILTGENNTNLTVSASGDYTATFVDQTNGCENESIGFPLKAVELPVSTITTEPEICVDVALEFVGQTSSFDTDFNIDYEWVFLDANSNQIGNSNTLVTDFTFTDAGNYSAVLTTFYTDVNNCESDVSENVTASDPPNLTISTPEGTEKCPSDSIRLEMPEGLSSYQWSDGSTNFFTYAKTARDEDQVTVSVDVVTEIQCAATDQVTVSNFPNSGLEISSPDEGATQTGDEIQMPDGAISITLEASGGSDYQWEPADIFDNPNQATVLAFPKSPLTQIILSGTDANGCEENSFVSLINNSVIGRKTFSPDGNNLGFDCWEIINSSTLNGCTVYIFDTRGRTVFTGDSPFDNDCVWDGRIENGADAEEGVYYYVLKCDDAQSKEFEQTGTILLARDNN